MTQLTTQELLETNKGVVLSLQIQTPDMTYYCLAYPCSYGDSIPDYIRQKVFLAKSPAGSTHTIEHPFELTTLADNQDNEFTVIESHSRVSSEKDRLLSYVATVFETVTGKQPPKELTTDGRIGDEFSSV